VPHLIFVVNKCGTLYFLLIENRYLFTEFLSLSRTKPLKSMHIFDHTLLKIIQVLISLFTGVLFLQSGFDKVFDFKGNKNYIESVFSKTFLNSFSGILFVIIIILEVLAGLASFFGAIFYFIEGQKDFAIFGLELSLLSILCLFTGQRIAKDYAGAASLVGYFLLIAFGLFTFTLVG